MAGTGDYFLCRWMMRMHYVFTWMDESLLLTSIRVRFCLIFYTRIILIISCKFKLQLCNLAPRMMPHVHIIFCKL